MCRLARLVPPANLCQRPLERPGQLAQVDHENLLEPLAPRGQLSAELRDALVVDDDRPPSAEAKLLLVRRHEEDGIPRRVVTNPVAGGEVFWVVGRNVEEA